MLTTDRQAQLLALCRMKGLNWYMLAREAQRLDGVDRLLAGDITEQSPEADAARALLPVSGALLDTLADEAVTEVSRATAAGAELFTVLDAGYPTNLRLIFNLPPFLFVRGEFAPADLRAVAVVGTRNASPAGVARAKVLAHRLAEEGVTVVSGLARGIDTAAHTAALDAGGRTIAVIGTGILRCYPAENADLAERIVRAGAVVSQFWPAAHPATYTFPRRNVTMSGIAQGTAVVEASATSGAKMQARIALEHGKKVFLLRALTEDQEWARSYVAKRGARMVDTPEEIVDALISPERVEAADVRREQLAMHFG